jgi:uncharacterized protein YbbK (DUF523 family)
MSGSAPDAYVADNFAEAISPKKPSCGSADMTHYSSAGESGARQGQVPSPPIVLTEADTVRSHQKRERSERSGSFFEYFFGS